MAHAFGRLKLSSPIPDSVKVSCIKSLSGAMKSQFEEFSFQFFEAREKVSVSHEIYRSTSPLGLQTTVSDEIHISTAALESPYRRSEFLDVHSSTSPLGLSTAVVTAFGIVAD